MAATTKQKDLITSFLMKFDHALNKKSGVMEKVLMADVLRTESINVVSHAISCRNDEGVRDNPISNFGDPRTNYVER